jgi:hypothetical protein
MKRFAAAGTHRGVSMALIAVGMAASSLPGGEV